jgi:hypothetical protein
MDRSRGCSTVYLWQTRNEVEAVGLVMSQGMIERRRFKIPVLFVMDRR